MCSMEQTIECGVLGCLVEKLSFSAQTVGAAQQEESTNATPTADEESILIHKVGYVHPYICPAFHQPGSRSLRPRWVQHQKEGEEKTL